MSRHDDTVSLRQMLDHAREAVALCRGKRYADLLTDRNMALALARLLHILGEAATRVSLPTHARYSDIPWADMIAIRNRLVHAYDKIDLEVLWDVVQNDLPPLIAALQRILGEPG